MSEDVIWGECLGQKPASVCNEAEKSLTSGDINA